jgi:pimeloyl-ACP methyl ester carboxylesterase
VETVRSADGTRIAFDRSGDGPPVIMVVGAFNDRTTAVPVSKLLEPDFTMYNYDRRGRGDSGDTPPYSIDRELEDLAALVDAAGGSAALFGYSSGAVLSLKAAVRGLAVTRLALYEPPFMVDGEIAGWRRSDKLRDNGRPQPSSHLPARIAELVAAGRRGDAVELFQTEAVGIPADVVARIRQAPIWQGLEAAAHTVVYDVTITNDPELSGELGSVAVPTLVIDGAQSPAWMRGAARSVADAVPGGRLRSLDGQTHDLNPEVLAPVLAEFYRAG